MGATDRDHLTDELGSIRAVRRIGQELGELAVEARAIDRDARIAHGDIDDRRAERATTAKRHGQNDAQKAGPKLGVDTLDRAEIEKDDAPVLLDQKITGMWIGVKYAVIE